MKTLLSIVSLTFLASLASAHQIPNFQTVRPNLFRGGRPSVSDLKELKQMGIQTILNLENDSSVVAKEAAVAKSLNINYISIPTATFSRPSDANVNRILEILNDTSKGSVFVHCTHGRDRTGLMIGLLRVETDHWKANVAYDEMVRLGFREYLAALKNYFTSRTAGKLF